MIVQHDLQESSIITTSCKHKSGISWNLEQGIVEVKACNLWHVLHVCSKVRLCICQRETCSARYASLQRFNPFLGGGGWIFSHKYTNDIRKILYRCKKYCVYTVYTVSKSIIKYSKPRSRSRDNYTYNNIPVIFRIMPNQMKSFKRYK